MFHRCKNIQEAKEIFRKCSKFLHPDTGGNDECFILLNESYEIFIEFMKISNQNDKSDSKNVNPKGCPGKFQNTDFDIDIGDERLEILSEMRKYAKKHKKFNVYFLDSLEEYLEEHNLITSSQYNSLVKTYYAFRMDKEE